MEDAICDALYYNMLFCIQSVITKQIF